MQNILSVISFLLIVNVLLLMFSVNSNAQSLSLNDSLQVGQKIKKGNDTLVPYEDAFMGRTLTSGVALNEGSIVSEGMLQFTGSTTFTLSNDIKVHYKYTDKNKNAIQFKALSYGGFSLVKDDDLPAAQSLGNMIALSGLGDYSATNLSKMLEGKTANTRIDLSDLTESIKGDSTTKDVEILLQMIHLHFVNPRFDSDAYELLIANLNKDIIRRSHTINEQIRDSVTTTLYGNNPPKQRLLNNDFVKDVSLERMKKLYKERFNNAADFEFFIVGDIQKNVLRPLLEKYIASIPTNNTREEWQDNSVPWLQNVINKDIPLLLEAPKSVVRIAYNNTMRYSLKHALIARALGDILQLRFTKIMKEKTIDAYTASVKANILKRPIEQASLHITLECNPDKIEQLITQVHEEIKKIEKGVVLQADLDKIKANYLKERKEQKRHNSYDMRVLINYFREGYNMNNLKNFEDLVNTITIKDLEVFTKALINDSRSYKIVFNQDRASQSVYEVKGMKDR